MSCWKKNLFFVFFSVENIFGNVSALEEYSGLDAITISK